MCLAADNNKIIYVTHVQKYFFLNLNFNKYAVIDKTSHFNEIAQNFTYSQNRKF